jgi:hypothetical protein
MKKITLATVKKFIKEAKGDLQIRSVSEFDGMCDGVRNCDGGYSMAILGDGFENTLGVVGAWFVFGSRDSFTEIDTPTHTGIHVYNCCGSFDLAVAKEAA